MKKIFLAASLIACFSFGLQAQRYAIVDTKFILDKIPEYKEDELFMREKELRDVQRQRFGFEGDLFKKRQELVKPIQDKVYTAIQKIAANRQYDFILDKSEGITVIFADPKLDQSEAVLKELGVK
jgi:outer membrane protein